jgi:hypothetical protein
MHLFIANPDVRGDDSADREWYSGQWERSRAADWRDILGDWNVIDMGHAPFSRPFPPL